MSSQLRSVIAGFAVALSAPALAQVDASVLSFTGQSVPGLGNALFVGSAPSISPEGDVLYSVFYEGGPLLTNGFGSALHRNAASTGAAIIDGQVFAGRRTFSFSDVRSDGDGGLLLSGLFGPDEFNTVAGVFSLNGGVLRPLLQQGDPLPGATDGATIGFAGVGAAAGSFLITTAQLNVADFTTGSAVVGLNVGTGVLSPIARAGDPAPGVPNATFSTSFGIPRVNESGQGVLAAFPQGPGLAFGNDAALFRITASGTAALAVAPGVQAPGFDAGAQVAVFSNATINASGRIAYVAAVFGPGINPDFGEQAIYVLDPGSSVPQLIARTGTQAPGFPPAHQLLGFRGVSLNANGEVGYFANVLLPGGDPFVEFEQALYFTRGGVAELIAATNTVTPDGSGIFLQLEGEAPALNAAGQLAFSATLIDLTSFEDVASLWLTDEAGQVQLVARSGQTVQLPTGNDRVIGLAGSIGALQATGGQDGTTTALSDDGRLAFIVSFDDGSSAVLATGAPVCPADFTNDGVLNVFDILAYFDAFATGDERADLNSDGTSNIFDIFAYFSLFAAGC